MKSIGHTVNETHDPQLRSWVESANQPGTDFPIQNLPFGVFRSTSHSRPQLGVAIGDAVLDLRECVQAGLLDGLAAEMANACTAPTLNPLMALPCEQWSELRGRVSELLRVDSSPIVGSRSIMERVFVPMRDAELLLPAEIGDYSDFYASIHHATKVGAMFRPDNPLLPNYKYVPIGYHGRASSIVASGTPVRRPCGQTKDDIQELPTFGPSRRLDYELEVGIFVGPGNWQGEPIPIAEAERHIFGVCLVNDWSARDIQKWEYQPLGPFLSKSFATTISPWVVTMEALAPFRVPALVRPTGDPPPLDYLNDPSDRERGGIDVTLEVWLQTQPMRDRGIEPVRLSRSNLRDMYWTAAQLLTHHTSNGCNVRPGDLLASGTVSGPAKDSRGCLLELTSRGSDPLTLPSGEQRRFLENGDEVILRGYCEGPGFVRIGLGECRGTVLPASAPAY
jgi:fumarylacetoacetase